MQRIERIPKARPALPCQQGFILPFGQRSRALKRRHRDALHAAGGQPFGQRVNRFQHILGVEFRGWQDAIGVHHLPDTVEQLHPAGDDPRRANGQHGLDLLLRQAEEDQRHVAGFIAHNHAMRCLGAAGRGRAMRLDGALQGDYPLCRRSGDCGRQRTIHDINGEVEQQVDDPRRLRRTPRQGVEQGTKLGADARQAGHGGKIGIKLERPHWGGIAPSTGRLQAPRVDFGLTSLAKRPFSPSGPCIGRYFRVL